MDKQTIAHDLDAKERTKDVILDENVSFESLLLPEKILKSLLNSGFRKPSPIQYKAIPLGRCGFDLIVKSKSGTGKTLVFSIIALESIKLNNNHLQALILVPTREIAVQIVDVLRNIGALTEGLKVESFIGGLPLDEDIRKIKDCHIAVGAPGRVKHLLSIGALSTKFIRLFVLDEADKLMESSFQDDINELYNSLPERKQIIASSATYPEQLDTFLSKYMLSPTHVSAEIETPILLGLKQFVYVLSTPSANAVQIMAAKNDALVEILSNISFTQCLVFSNYQTRAESVSNFLNQKGWNSIYISAAQSQAKRLEAVNNLKEFKSRILLSTDLTARGIDAPNVDLVVNYDIPVDAVTYLHRMGRAGRYGAAGVCINLAMNGTELTQLQNIIGAIGAANLSISKLPPLNGSSPVDVWQLDLSKLEQIYGTVKDSSEIKEDIKNEIMALKESCVPEQTPKKNKRKPKSRSVESKTEADSLSSVDQSEEAKSDNVGEDLETENLLQSLLLGQTIDDEEQSEVADENSILLQSLIDGAVEDDGKKRKRSSPNESNEEKRKNDNRNVTYCKNKALLSITRLLCDPTTKPDSDIVESVDEFLHIMKEDQIETTTHEATQRSRSVDMEDIFQLGYECALTPDKEWINLLPSGEYEAFKKACMENVSESEEDYLDEEEDSAENQMEASDGSQECVHVESRVQNQDISLRWMPVESNESPSDPHSEHYIQCFNDCSETLWQNGLTFENVDDFDYWYYQWQQNLGMVRNYVQQNIYVQEMSKYQQSRLPK